MVKYDYEINFSSLKKVKRRSGKTVGGLSQEYLLVTIKDETERELEIVANWQGHSFTIIKIKSDCTIHKKFKT